MTLFDGEADAATSPRLVSSAVGVAEVGHVQSREQMSEYLDRSLPDRERTRLDAHLQHCPPCRAYLRTLCATVQSVGSLPRQAAPDSIKQRLLRIPEE